jgi:molybdopterin-containing oxidoreductase family iron-sulfur binding subunit
MKRRDFLIAAGGTLLAGGATAVGVNKLSALGGETLPVEGATAGCRWGMVIDLNRCREDCDACVRACREENNVAFHGDEQWDIYWIRKVKVHRQSAASAREKPVLVLCNQCDHPPCAQVCPVQATYQRHDGVVLVDQHRCIGCRYCIIACPYSVRFFNYRENPDWPNKDRPRRSHGVAESCNLCVHRLDTGRIPACMEACQKVGANAILVGDLNDLESDVSRLIAAGGATRLREDLGTEPKVYYLGL